VNREDVDVAELVRESAAMLRPQAAKKGITLEVSGPSGGPRTSTRASCGRCS
jgi:signal transduction histidine kinase